MFTPEELRVLRAADRAMGSPPAVGKPRRGGRTYLPLTDEQRTLAIQLHDNGLGWRPIAHQLHIQPARLKRELGEAYTIYPSTGKPKDP